MATVTLCTKDDLLFKLKGVGAGTPEEQLVKLCADRYVAGVSLISDADVQARYTRGIEDASRYIKNRLRDKVALSDSEVADDLRRLAVVLVLNELYCDAGMYGAQSNPFADRRSKVDAELVDIRELRQTVGASGSQTALAIPYTSTGESDTDYQPAAYGGGGTSNNILEKM